jgi:hypothetical protein
MTVTLFICLLAGFIFGWFAWDWHWKRAMRKLEHDFRAQFPNGCLRCVAERHGDQERADVMGWKHSATCTKENQCES